MFIAEWKFVLAVAFVALCQPQACYTQYQSYNGGSVSRASSTASEHQLGLGLLGLSSGAANAQTHSESNGGYGNGGTTSLADSRSRTHGVNLAGLNIGSTLTSSKTQTNGEVSRGLAHDFNVGGLGIGSSLSTDNLNNGVGLQHSQHGGLQLGLGLLNLDLSRRQQQQSHAQTQAQAQAHGVDAYSTSNSNANTESRQFGLLGLSNTHSQSNALSATRYGHTSASAGGNAEDYNIYEGIGIRRTRSYDVPSSTFVRPKRRAQYIPYQFPGGEYNQPRRKNTKHGSRRPGFGFPQGIPQQQNANAQGLANNRNDYFQQQAGANTQSNQEINKNGLFQHNGASSIGSNLATDGSSGQLSSSNVNQDISITDAGSQSTNNAQSQALNFAQNQQQAANANAGTKEIQTDDGQRYEAQGGSQATNNNEYGSSSNIANTNSLSYENGDSRGAQADASGQSIFQGNNGQNSAAQTNSNVNSVQGPNGYVSNTANSNASAVSNGGQNANAVASASSTADANGSGGGGGGNAFGNANTNAGNFGNFGNLGGAQAASGAYGNLNGAQGFGNGRSRFRG